jgi:hypothetical protein
MTAASCLQHHQLRRLLLLLAGVAGLLLGFPAR